jgi:hypothetical protein
MLIIGGKYLLYIIYELERGRGDQTQDKSDLAELNSDIISN